MIYDLQKASLWKRISAFLFDIIILLVITLGIGVLLAYAFNTDGYINSISEGYVKYEEKYGVDFDISTADFEKLTEEERAVYNKAYEEMNKDEEISHATQMIFSLSLLILSASFLVSFVVLEFIIPLFFKNGQTLGKKIFGIGVMRTNSVKASTPVLFIRMLLGKYTIETMVPVFLLIMIWFNILGIVGAIVIIGLIILEIVIMCATHTNSAIHDLLSDTVVVDMASQLIFESEQAMIDYKKKLHAEEVAKAQY